jgi:hypothetical protein
MLVLRRGKEELTLPPKTEPIVQTVLDADERWFYDKIVERMVMAITKYAEAGTLGYNIHHLWVLYKRCQQAALHPGLALASAKRAPWTVLTLDQQIKLAKKFPRDAVAMINADPSSDCVVCFQASSNPYLVLPCGHRVRPLFDGLTAVLYRVPRHAVSLGW